MKRLIVVNDMGKSELEVKVLNYNLKNLEKKLVELGAKLIGKEKQINYILENKFKKIKSSNSYLRIRKTESLLDGKSKLTLTYKKNLSNSMVRENIEYNVGIKEDDRSNLMNIFKELGFEIVDTGYKKRTSYCLNNSIRFDLDQWDEETYPHPYMEIEVKEEKDLRLALELLKIDDANVTIDSIADLKNKL